MEPPSVGALQGLARLDKHLRIKGTGLSTHGKAILFQGQDNLIDVEFGASVSRTGLFIRGSCAVTKQNKGNGLFNQGTVSLVAGPDMTTSGTDQTPGSSGLIQGGIAGATTLATLSVIDTAGTTRNLAGGKQ